ncbi:MAG: hypothetical protein A2X23_06460 [Chloroflexi bacterium GWC2_73_18]|nr:MAG: hypothetical protein A2X23_06460 [Chloroflexi bacterium GWC2_73_18]
MSRGGERQPRTGVERALLGLVAAVFAASFATVGLVAFAGGEVFLGAMGLLGALMTLWVGALTVLRR